MKIVKVLLGLLAILISCGVAAASEESGSASIVEIPMVHNVPARRYWTKANTALVVTDAAAKSLDMLFTMRNASRPGFHEYDPLARPFVTHGAALAGTSQGILFAGEVFASYELQKHGHRKMARVLLLMGIGGNTTGFITSMR